MELATLSSGGTVAKPLDLRTVFDDLETNPAAVWAQLYQAGYVTTSDTGYPNDSRRPRELNIPNLEVWELYEGELLARATRLACSAERLRALHRAVAACDAPAAQDRNRPRRGGCPPTRWSSSWTGRPRTTTPSPRAPATWNSARPSAWAMATASKAWASYAGVSPSAASALPLRASACPSETRSSGEEVFHVRCQAARA